MKFALGIFCPYKINVYDINDVTVYAVNYCKLEELYQSTYTNQNVVTLKI